MMIHELIDLLNYLAREVTYGVGIILVGAVIVTAGYCILAIRLLKNKLEKHIYKEEEKEERHIII